MSDATRTRSIPFRRQVARPRVSATQCRRLTRRLGTFPFQLRRHSRPIQDAPPGPNFRPQSPRPVINFQTRFVNWLCLASPAYGSLMVSAFICMCLSIFYVYVKSQLKKAGFLYQRDVQNGIKITMCLCYADYCN